MRDISGKFLLVNNIYELGYILYDPYPVRSKLIVLNLHYVSQMKLPLIIGASGNINLMFQPAPNVLPVINEARCWYSPARL